MNISAPSIVSGMSGESEKTLRDTFDEAKVCSSVLNTHSAIELNWMLAASTLSPVYRRSRCYHTETRKCAEGDGEKDCGSVFNVHGRYSFS